MTVSTLTTTLFETLASARLCSSSPIDHVWGSPDGARLENRALMFLSTRWNVLRILKTSWRFSTSSPSCLPTKIRPAGPSLGARAQTRDGVIVVVVVVVVVLVVVVVVVVAVLGAARCEIVSGILSATTRNQAEHQPSQTANPPSNRPITKHQAQAAGTKQQTPSSKQHAPSTKHQAPSTNQPTQATAPASTTTITTTNTTSSILRITCSQDASSFSQGRGAGCMLCGRCSGKFSSEHGLVAACP